MKTRYIIIALIACIATSLYVRIVLPYDQVFSGEWIKFGSIDAYWQMAQVDRIAPDFPAHFIYVFKFPEVVRIPFFIWLLSGITWCIGLGSPTQHTIDTVGAYYPVILAALTIIPVYFIGKVMFGRMAGLIAAILIAILPGEWLGRSVLGFTDDHVAEVLFSTTMIMFFVMALKSAGRRQIIYTLLSALFLAMFLTTFKAGIIFVLVMGFVLFIQVMKDGLNHRYHISYPIVLLSVGVIAMVMIELVKPDSLSTMAQQLAAYASGSTAVTTMEMQPFLFPFGTFTLSVAWATFGFIVFILPLAMGGLAYRAIRSGDSGTILLILWSIATLAMMLEARRFAYFFAVNVALIMGWFTWYLWHRLNKKHILSAIVVTSFLLAATIIPNAQYSFAMAKQAGFPPPEGWHDTLSWIKQNTPEESLIVAWWDHGYWIKRIAQREAYANPSQDPKLVTKVANLFLDQPGERAKGDYIILDHDIVTGKMWAVATWAGMEPEELSSVYYIVKDGERKPLVFYYPEYYQSLAVGLFNFDGKAVTPTQSTVIVTALGSNVLVSIDVYATYEKALANKGVNGRIVGTSPFISPIPLEAERNYTLVYTSELGLVKVFKRVR